MEIVGVSHPIPTNFAIRIYDKNKTVFVGKSYLSKVVKGDKFIIYESHGAKAYTGIAEIESIGRTKPAEILKKFKEKLMINPKEFQEYSKAVKKMNYIQFKNFKKFKKPVKPARFVGIRGKYISEVELKKILANQE